MFVSIIYIGPDFFMLSFFDKNIIYLSIIRYINQACLHCLKIKHIQKNSKSSTIYLFYKLPKVTDKR